MLKEIIILVLVGYVISRVLKFILPIFRITTAASSQMRKMQEQMQAQMQEAERQKNQNNQPTQKRTAQKEGDYIEYEEVRP